MLYAWYKIFNLTSFIQSQLVSKKYSVSLEQLGPKEVLTTKGITYSISVDGYLIVIPESGELEEIKTDDGQGIAVYVDTAMDVWLGYEV